MDSALETYWLCFMILKVIKPYTIQIQNHSTTKLVSSQLNNKNCFRHTLFPETAIYNSFRAFRDRPNPFQMNP